MIVKTFHAQKICFSSGLVCLCVCEHVCNLLQFILPVRSVRASITAIGRCRRDFLSTLLAIAAATGAKEFAPVTNISFSGARHKLLVACINLRSCRGAYILQSIVKSDPLVAHAGKFFTGMIVCT
jgi:hypothetical protein